MKRIREATHQIAAFVNGERVASRKVFWQAEDTHFRRRSAKDYPGCAFKEYPADAPLKRICKKVNGRGPAHRSAAARRGPINWYAEQQAGTCDKWAQQHFGIPAIRLTREQIKELHKIKTSI